MDEDDRDLLLACSLVIIAALAVLAIASIAYARPVVIVTTEGEEIRGMFLGAELGEPVLVMVDTSHVFGSGFE